MKSLANGLLDIALGIIKDVRVAYPQLKGVDLDVERLALNCQTRGLGFFSLDLPSLDSALLQGLEHGFLASKGPLMRAGSKKTSVPRFLQGLWLKVFDRTGVLKEEPDINAIFFLRQIFCLGKKVQLTCSPKRLSNALKEYVNVESETIPPTLAWDEDELDPLCVIRTISLTDFGTDRLPLFESLDRGSVEDERKTSGILLRVQQVADLVATELGPFHPIHYSGGKAELGLRTGFKHGPGAVADRTGRVNKYDMPRWSAKLERTFPYRLCGTIASDLETLPINHEVASKLFTVPKTAKAPRLIASEPTEHQFCQGLVADFLVNKLEAMFGTEFICFKDQGLSGKMALQASLDRSLATIDLSSASDRLSCRTVERVFRMNYPLLRALHAVRTRYIRLQTDGVSSFIKLKKFASQGTATTFPVQSLVFLIIALGACIEGEVNWTNIRRLRGRVRTFGDDIIVPNERYADVTAVLHALGLKVNMEKSFHKGHFRESCGVDAYKGYDVTPVKPSVVTPDGPQSRMAVLDTSNNFHLKGMWHASTVIESTLGDRYLRRLPIVGRDCGTVGRRSFTGRSTDHLETRWNIALHRQEWRIWTFQSRSGRLPTGERFALLQYFTEAPYSRLHWEHGIAKRAVVRDNVRWDPLYG